MARPQNATGPTRGHRRWLPVWGVVLTVFVVMAFRGVAWGDAVELLADANWGWLALAVLANAAILPLAAYQWTRFLPDAKPVGFGQMFWITTVTSTVSNGGPFMAGHAAGVQLLASEGGVGYPTAVSVKVLDQLAEGLAKLSLVAVAFLLAPLPGPFRKTAFGLALGLPVLAAGLVFAAHRGHRLERLAERWPGRRGRVLGFLSEVAHQLESLRRPWTFAWCVFLALAQKVAEGLGLLAVLVAVGIHLPLWGLVAVLVGVNVSTMASVTPANLGVYEASALLAYHLAGVDVDVALPLAIIQHVAYLVPMAGAGWVALALTGLGFGSAAVEEGGDAVGAP